MARYRLAIFDFDGTLADSLAWFRSEIPGVVARFDLAPLPADELESLRALSGREILARLKVPLWKLPAIVDDMRRRKLAAADKISLFDGVPALLSSMHDFGIATAIVSSDSEESVRRVLGPHAIRICRFDCGASIFGKHRKFASVARRLDTNPADAICIGDEIRDIEAAKRAGMHSGAVAWGYTLPDALKAAGPTYLFNTIEDLKHAMS
jgi:phosphoglycolate phosphatase